MLYIVYLPKSKGEILKDRKIIKILKWYTKLTQDKKYSILAAPGYLSKTTETIDEFLSSMSEVLLNDDSRKIGLLYGMNGNQSLSDSTNTIYNEHIKKFGKYKFDTITLSPKATLDHRKMMCFFYEEDVEYSEITLENLEKYLQNVHVGAMLIGSSNQSNTSYFEKNASKGEADIFLIDASCDKKVQRMLKAFEAGEQGDQQELFVEDNIVIAKSFFGKGDADTQEFMKGILREVLVNGLEK